MTRTLQRDWCGCTFVPLGKSSPYNGVKPMLLLWKAFESWRFKSLGSYPLHYLLVVFLDCRDLLASGLG
nr:hypothetical protein CFP56_55163 [Quercus suber]